MEINWNAPIRSCHEIKINAPLETVWRVHTQINRWPDWNPDITKANLTGPIAVGTVFHWETAGMAIPSTIGEVVPLRKLAWSGETGGILGVHVWDFFRAPRRYACSYGRIVGRGFASRANERHPRCAGRVSRPVAFIPEDPRGSAGNANSLKKRLPIIRRGRSRLAAMRSLDESVLVREHMATSTL